MKTFDDVVKLLKHQPLLVANRGISARRICRSFKERFDAIAVMTATDIDKASPAAAAAHELMLLGEDPRAYLDLERIISLAKRRGVLGIHPGWGFASEDELFPRLCQEAGLVFIGSTAEAMNLLGNKVEVRKLAKSLDIPVVPGSDGAVDVPEARRVAAEIGFPIMLKAEGGGGGKGIIEVHNERELEDAFLKASTMAQASFGNPRVFVEKFLSEVRHIEIQVIADQYGNIFCFDERDCTIQRNNQKLAEITPSPWPAFNPELRQVLKGYARRLVAKVGYHSLCTVEFLITPDLQPYLIEVNTRLQVEHGITEARYGVDLVEEQIAIAFGAPLRFTELETRPTQVAMQLRINLEDPQHDFTPNSGQISRYVSTGGPGVRLDSNLTAGYEFPSNYDSAGALLITYGRDWAKVMGIMERALGEYIVGGLKTTMPFYRALLKTEDFKRGIFTTRFIEQHPELLEYSDVASEAVRLAKLAAEITARGYNPFVQLGVYRSSQTPRMPRFEPVLPKIPTEKFTEPSPYPRGDRRALLDYVRDSGKIHFCDTTCRDVTQSNSGNRFRLAEDRLVGPQLDNCDFFSLETGGGAHFHVAMLANMTYPFTEAAKWNEFAPKTMKQILIRSTNILGYKPQPATLMEMTGELICRHFQVVRCFDFLNHAENMKPFAEVVMAHQGVLFEPALSLSWGPGFTVEHYLEAAEALMRMVADASGLPVSRVPREIALGLKDMAGVCPPRFMTELVTALKKRWPELVLHYHRHYTDGLFVPSVAAAARAGAQIVDTALGASVRSYGQGDVLATSAYIEEELGLEVMLDRDMVRQANFVLKQIMPYYDRYVSPYFQGIDHDVVRHGMPGGATSSSQEGAMKQGYIKLLPYMLRFLAGARRIVRYHDVTPGSQITWNTAFLGVTAAYNRGGLEAVRHLLEVLETVAATPEDELDEAMKRERLIIYRDCNDAFRDLLLGKFGRLPLGFPSDWVYQSAFGENWEEAIGARTEDSPLEYLPEIDLLNETATLREAIGRPPTEDELVMFLNQPADALKTIRFRQTYGNPNNLPLDVWFEGLETGQPMNFTDTSGKPHQMVIHDIQKPDIHGVATVRYVLDSEIMRSDITVAKPSGAASAGGPVMAQNDNPFHVAAPSNGDLWVMYVKPGDVVTAGQELFNIAIMKQEKAVNAPLNALVKRVLKRADFKATKEMVPVRAGELIVELAPLPHFCNSCQKALPIDELSFCPYCGAEVQG
ncbi:pyruvate carboxylase [Deltaproteobacteria bacterium OttesenSCG-928-M10]|nr:pyruvate carboxylase [Deltaproteobacteria bacterium OttesenSCG-928-M10]